MKSIYAANSSIAHRYGGDYYVPPTTVYVGLLTQDPQPDESELVEPASGGYARVPLLNDSDNFPAPVDGEITVAADVLFPEPTGPWGTVSHFAFFDALTGGNMLDYSEILDPDTGLPVTPEINSGDTVVFYEGSLTFKEE